MAKTVLIIGGSYSGIAVAHRLLKYTLPSEKDLKVILVSASTHFYWNLASVRLVVPGVWKDEQVFQAIEPGFANYPSESFELVIGKATAVDTAAKTAKIAASAGGKGDGEGERSISYDYLVLATGSRSADASMPWKVPGPYEEALEKVHSVADKIKAANHIVIAGAGATGIELAGEIRYEFKDKTVVLLSADESVAGGDSTAGSIEKELGKLGVEIKKGTRSTGSETRADGKTEVKVSKGESIVTDLYLPTIGLVANTEYLSTEHLREDKYIAVDDQLRVKGAKDAWALGDVINRPRSAYVNVEPQAAGVSKNIEAAIKGKDQQVVKNLPVDPFICSIGRGRSAGRIGFVPILSFMGWMIKGKTLGSDKLPKFVNGTQF